MAVSTSTAPELTAETFATRQLRAGLLVAGARFSADVAAKHGIGSCHGSKAVQEPHMKPTRSIYALPPKVSEAVEPSDVAG
jgi:hypothetical protein